MADGNRKSPRGSGAWGESFVTADLSAEERTTEGVYPLDREAFAHGGSTSDEHEAELMGDGVVDLDSDED